MTITKKKFGSISKGRKKKLLKFFNSNPAIISLVTLSITIMLVILGWRVLFNNAKKLATRNLWIVITNTIAVR